MADSIFIRISRILAATVEDRVERLEKAGGEGVMRQAIREANNAVEQVKAEQAAIVARRLLAERQFEMLTKRIQALTEKARFAIENGRDDLAEAALAQQLDFEGQAARLAEARDDAWAEEQRIEEGLTALKARKVQMEDTLSAYRQAQAEASGGGASSQVERSAERQVDAAEEAFARAMAGTGSRAAAQADFATIRRVADIDVLQRRAAIAERLAALKAARAA